MKRIKVIPVFVVIWLLMNILTGLTFFEKGYLVSWGIFVSLIVMYAVSMILLIVYLVVFMIKFLTQRSYYKIGGRVFRTFVWVIVLPTLVCLQVVASEFFIYSPSNQATASIEEVTIHGTSQYYSVRTQDESNPVILFLAGGPGGTQIPTTRVFLEELEENLEDDIS